MIEYCRKLSTFGSKERHVPVEPKRKHLVQKPQTSGSEDENIGQILPCLET